ncbi:hypothetical protein LNO81_31160 [Klebsiella variicola subsp. variicola]|nr:hypothetical protein [Klebsiella variicola subsp. variicola]
MMSGPDHNLISLPEQGRQLKPDLTQLTVPVHTRHIRITVKDGLPESGTQTGIGKSIS